ncbi:MBOAT family O-acyltransferase [Mucilaginibacter pocheonensis]|uniref:D-alanyl-lipoteichoic acid acyltransferase DltB (MBOAT superfamily) n=1 Tax=Mucilaginibacter pocheonensis TaxID=398050 RepID=A0ABU1TG84_9SPHI|nr:MBOAT family O-acyltransferase [Mucilaginibacter pocheonensis]MDR6944309.1 D-alanyl-lipoteichoic acid acyltransferase DltB (MBOAT superfamily) [Mucilaginibacter pocheonensis]
MSEAKSIKSKKGWFWLSVIVNLGFLGVFKYYNFFAQSFVDMFGHFGVHMQLSTINVILPVGISFYTFHGLSYVIDIYKDRIKPERNFIDYSLFVSFFPLLVAGPIERATHLLPQIKKKRHFDYVKAIDGLRQILWGLFKKVVIADNCAEYANLIFNHSSNYSGSSLVLGALLFTFQIYCDFSGYSDIAIGTARLLGIELLRNFAFPYFSRDIAEFWRRWHISLSSWFKDYLYIPLGGSKGGLWMRVRNTFIIFLVSGFWHGANWTFIIWGGLNALFIMPSIIFKTNRSNLDIVAKGRLLPSARELFDIVLTFSLTVLAWIFFRSASVGQAFQIIGSIFTKDLFKAPQASPRPVILAIIILFMIIEWIGREGKYAIENIGMKWTPVLRWSFYSFIIVCIGMYMETTGSDFIYFQF